MCSELTAYPTGKLVDVGRRTLLDPHRAFELALMGQQRGDLRLGVPGDVLDMIRLIGFPQQERGWAAK
jgi:hypothetical protein